MKGVNKAKGGKGKKYKPVGASTQDAYDDMTDIVQKRINVIKQGLDPEEEKKREEAERALKEEQEYGARFSDLPHKRPMRFHVFILGGCLLGAFWIGGIFAMNSGMDVRILQHKHTSFCQPRRTHTQMKVS